MEREFRNLKYSLPLYIDEVMTRAFSLADFVGGAKKIKKC